MPSHRAKSAAQIVRSVIAEVARQIPPDVAQIVSITEVVMSTDVAHATVYVTAFRDPGAAIKRLQSKDAKHDIHRRLARELQTYTVPTLRFVIDDRPEKASKIEELLK